MYSSTLVYKAKIINVTQKASLLLIFCHPYGTLTFKAEAPCLVNNVQLPKRLLLTYE